MKRFAILSALALVLCAPLVLAQTPPPAQKAKFIPPVKTTATIDVQRISQKRAGKEIRTIIKVRNTSKGSINLLAVDQYWYDRGSKQVSFGDYRHKKAPIQPNEVVEITIMAPDNPQISHDLLMFKHAYGKVEARQVKKIE
jgi:hypothetical protein